MEELEGVFICGLITILHGVFIWESLVLQDPCLVVLLQVELALAAILFVLELTIVLLMVLSLKIARVLYFLVFVLVMAFPISEVVLV